MIESSGYEECNPSASFVQYLVGILWVLIKFKNSVVSDSSFLVKYFLFSFFVEQSEKNLFQLEGTNFFELIAEKQVCLAID
ncbi:hypothetical protein Gasu2_49710 [Galdieria sulphuraria]|uniref:Uncharacterized protein n=1 Tax=Galdieria sulphuraria TaxID=130081 RepID=M2Y4G3_GALSU|nr:uncharacterized protein Gasu_19680 [Galdieria sulphuraria]EME30729.1 hypothetical protein Gasu_19680 [Galdieria sulphuraria]GJD10801.1 hypothetical protein Gasu2_49710 [Galdieria sulphuraria]|eukprot:XP_005707249.1 hypothetical protein Gasu_19680 [Galdieria sulphuraria]